VAAVRRGRRPHECDRAGSCARGSGDTRATGRPDRLAEHPRRPFRRPDRPLAVEGLAPYLVPPLYRCWRAAGGVLCGPARAGTNPPAHHRSSGNCDDAVKVVGDLLAVGVLRPLRTPGMVYGLCMQARPRNFAGRKRSHGPKPASMSRPSSRSSSAHCASWRASSHPCLGPRDLSDRACEGSRVRFPLPQRRAMSLRPEPSLMRCRELPARLCRQE
jgi:hypothetical protein